MTNSWHVERANYPTSVSQFQLYTDDGFPPEDATKQCWAAAAAALIQNRTGVVVSPDAAKDIGLGQGLVGEGNSANIQTILNHWHVPNAVVTPFSTNALLVAEYKHLMAGHSCIINRYLHAPPSPTNPNPGGHWLTVIGQIGHDYTVDYVVLHDPETGMRVVEAVALHLAMALPIAPDEYLMVCEES